MGYNLLINGVYWGYNPLTNHLLTSWDIQVVSRSRSQTPQTPTLWIIEILDAHSAEAKDQERDL